MVDKGARVRQVQSVPTTFVPNCSCSPLKGAVSQQSSSFCLILPITRPQSLWNLKLANKLLVNDEIRDPRQTSMSSEHYC